MTPAASSTGRLRPAPVADVASELHDAFARELAVRLPRLLAAADAMTGDDPDLARPAVAVLRHEVHTLASSAVIVGATAAAKAGRECEWLLLPYDDGSIPPEVAAKAGALARSVGRALARWMRG